MRTGTRSLLFGVHAFWWHPYVVVRAWRALYGRWPTWRQVRLIVIHDWGYWGSPRMDDDYGEDHPRRSVALGRRLGLVRTTVDEVFLLYHSRHLARRDGQPPSVLCWPDKLSLLYEPAWFYLLRARLSGELAEYRRQSANAGFIPLAAPDAVWFGWIQEHFARTARDRTTTLYTNPERGVRDG